MQCLSLEWLESDGIAWGQELVRLEHYLSTRVATICSVQGYAVSVAGERAGVLLFGRPQCQRCLPWYGSVADVRTGRCTESRWSILNLARIYFLPAYQRGGAFCSPDYLPGFVDRKGIWHSTLASTAIALALDRIVVEYLMVRPPCFLDEPYAVSWCLSYSDPVRHRGTLYEACGFERYRANARGLVTWRKRLRPLTPGEDEEIRLCSRYSARSRKYRAARAAAGWKQPSLLE